MLSLVPPAAVPSAVVAGVGLTLSGTAAVLRRSAALELSAVLDLGGGVGRGWRQLLAAPEVDLVVLDETGPERLRKVRQLADSGKAVLLADPFPLTVEELDGLLTAERASDRPIGLLAPHRALLGAAAQGHSWGPLTCGVLAVSGFRQVEAHRWGRWGALADGAPAQAALRAVAPYLDLVCQLLGEPQVLCSLGPGSGADVGLVDFAQGARLAWAVTSRATAQVERLDLLDGGHRLRLEDGWLHVEGPAGRSTTELTSLPAAHELLLGEMAAAINAVGKLRYCSLAAGRGLAMLLGAWKT
ncbi:hypothetical protein GXW83_06280 [Streptacidiphilus sp. PB12-B1b]|uniref:hypothetical protein n=1 Tax=Streptacidiphilus sp. PB12-B1b TaxID=2705012 RepID=UPI0015F78CE5|nr:hypothetical protein [Streptacidiphilus sp. PB12-B1b]QMU75415.1 hypothetical protein GXW83_06280 [Streptacidiphilus sp. PB12-B1b]